MNRILLLLFALLFAAAPAAAQRFEPSRFSVEVVGRGPDVILIPGLTAGRGVWRATAAAVPGYRYHLVQVAGFAGEPARGNRAGPVVAPLAEEIARYIADRGLERPAIVGHSMGGTIAMMIAARRPELAGRIMVVDMLPQPAGLFGGNARDAAPLADFMATPGGSRLFASLMAVFSPTEVARGSDPGVVARATRDLATTDLSGRLARIRAPFTVVYASPDRVASAAVDDSFERAYAWARNVRLVRIDGSGHMVMLDRPARFRAALRDFLRR
ncbi:MAG TPA: alpha/beta hydrolase [Allosphingosinicella sp.]|nr:alpha/beta hydrolase [Allosphingosinicella sp.]